jgi:hypothetical protein
MSGPSNSQSLKPVSLILSRGNSLPGSTAPTGPAERDSKTQAPPLPGGLLDTSSRAATSVDTSPLSPELDCAGEDQEDIDFREAQANSTATPQVLAQVIEFAQREKISDLQLPSGRHIYVNAGGSTRPYKKGETLRGTERGLLNAKQITPEVYAQFYQGTGLGEQ